MKKLFFLLCMIAALNAVACKKNNTDSLPANPTNTPDTPITEVPDEFVGAWENGSIDFTLWENYREGYYAGRNAAPSREAMIFYKNGEAKFYRYEFGYGMYEELIDCTGTVTFNNDGTFTFYPTKGRKRYIDSRYSPNSKDRALTSAELTSPKLAGKRKYEYIGSNPPVIRITVPSSAPYNWYKKS